jgi:peptide/nickel transport system substrate-binding protein
VTRVFTWRESRNRGISRRGVLQAAALGSSAAAFALACGGGSSGDSKKDTRTIEEKQEAVKTLISDRPDTSAQAVPGGILQWYTTADVTNLDPLSSPSFTAAAATNYTYNRLFKYKTGYRDKPADGTTEGDLVEKFEQPDPTTLIVKLRQNAVWDARPPTNKRPLDADDVVFSWNKFAASGINRTDLATKANPAAPVVGMDASDKSTIVIKTTGPYAPLLGSLAFTRYLLVMPRESDGGFDPRNETRGSGAWTLENYQRSVIFQWRKNPNYFGKAPYLDGMDFPIIPEYAAGLAQFRAKRVWNFAVRPEDQIQMKQDFPEITMVQDELGRAVYNLQFGFQPGSPFLDERVRKAVSMLVNRDEFIDSFGNVTQFRNAGFPVDTRWHSPISSGEPSWLDPKTDAIGAEAKKNWEFNPAEAKKLLAAAGQSGLSTDFTYISSGQYGTTFPKQAEVLMAYLTANNDFKLRQNNPDYQTEYLPKYWYNPTANDYKGIVCGAYTTFTDVDGYLFAYYHSKSNIQRAGLGAQGDPQADSLIEAQRRELDANKRTGILKDVQKYLATKMYMVPWPGQATTFTQFWPWVSNRGVYRAWLAESYPQETAVTWWFDKSKYTG